MQVKYLGLLNNCSKVIDTLWSAEYFENVSNENKRYKRIHMILMC